MRNCRAHPARDILYLLYVNTDSDFRKAHLRDLLLAYFGVFYRYLTADDGTAADTRPSFQSFVREVGDRIEAGVIGGLIVMPNVISPNHRDMGTLSDFNESQR